uniref:Uncharacterized protein n=1 Tax=Arundo donax TaxID=35708 RepID=A0A0A8YPB7_ARUDO
MATLVSTTATATPLEFAQVAMSRFTSCTAESSTTASVTPAAAPPLPGSFLFSSKGTTRGEGHPLNRRPPHI